MIWQPRHALLFARLLQDHPFGTERAALRRTFDRHFPQFSGYSFAGALRTLENQGIVSRDPRPGRDSFWASYPAVDGWHLAGVLKS